MIGQKQQLKQQMKFLPQQMMLMKLLQVPAVALEQTIKDELEVNPMLEEYAKPDDLPSEPEANAERTELSDFDPEDYTNEQNGEGYIQSSVEGSGERSPIFSSFEESMQEYVREQLVFFELSEEEHVIAREIIGNLDESGYFSRSLSAFRNDLILSYQLESTEEKIKKVLRMIQSLDPPGVGATDLQECLLIQLKRLNPKTEQIELAIHVIEESFDAFVKKHYEKIAQKWMMNSEILQEVVDLILALNPKPSQGMNQKGSQYIIPDFFLYSDGGQVEYSINEAYIPNLRLSRLYSGILEDLSSQRKISAKEKETLFFVKKQLESAKWFIEAVQQRQGTLEKTFAAIVDYQRDFFLEGDFSLLRPMRLKDIADRTMLDISTISRVVNQKYVQTHFGTYLLKDFFSNSLKDEEGREVASDTIRKILSDCIANEDKKVPHTDEDLKRIMQEKGYPLARRTLAKYREQLKIPVARLRRSI